MVVGIDSSHSPRKLSSVEYRETVFKRLRTIRRPPPSDSEEIRPGGAAETFGLLLCGCDVGATSDSRTRGQHINNRLDMSLAGMFPASQSVRFLSALDRYRLLLTEEKLTKRGYSRATGDTALAGFLISGAEEAVKGPLFSVLVH